MRPSREQTRQNASREKGIERTDGKWPLKLYFYKKKLTRRGEEMLNLPALNNNWIWGSSLVNTGRKM